MKLTQKTKTKKADLNTKIGKYFIAKQKGMTKTQASIVAGYPTATHTTRIEETKAYQAIQKIYYRDELLQQISLREIAHAHVENIKQDKDKGARNKAIQMALSKVEPEDALHNEDERVIVVLSG